MIVAGLSTMRLDGPTIVTSDGGGPRVQARGIDGYCAVKSQLAIHLLAASLASGPFLPMIAAA